jgi:hypothetical protein
VSFRAASVSKSPKELPMSSTRRSLSLALVVCAAVSVPLRAETRKPAPSDGTVTGALTVNGKKFPLTHIYARKREAWPADAKDLGVKEGELTCGIVELIATNAALPEATLAAILQNDYHGSDKIRGIRLLIDAGGSKWQPLFLLESGTVHPYGMTQSSANVEGSRRFKGQISVKNEDVTQVRIIDVSIDVPLRVQYARTEAEGAEWIPSERFAEEFLKAMPGQWKIERWLGLGCTTAGGTLAVGDRVSPRAFRGTFHITTSKGDEVEEEVTISTSGTKVHIEGEKVNVPESIWIRDNYDLDFWKGLMIGNNATDFVVLRKSPL